jgi:hypothetical protein
MSLDANIVSNLDAGNNFKVALPNTPAQVGSLRFMSENDPGALTGAPYLRSPETSSDYRLRVGLDTILLSETFNITSTAMNYNSWKYSNATMTALGTAAGNVSFGVAQGTASGHYAALQSYQYFPIIGTAPLAAEFTVGLVTATIIANETISMGFGVPGVAALPTDGVFFQLTSAGLIGVVVFNNNTTQTGVLADLVDFTVGSMYQLMIVVGEREIEFWRDSVLLGAISIPVANGQPFIQGSLPVFTMKHCTGTVSNTNTFRLCDLTVSLLDIATNLPYSHQQALQGMHAYQQQNGVAVAGTVTTNQAVGTITTGSTPQSPTASAGSNTTANITGLGGWGAINAAAGAATDFIASSFQNPVPTINLTGRNLMITGVTISTINGGAAVATTPTTLLWTLAFGHTAVSLQTAEAAATHAPRRYQLGFQSAPIGAAIGQPYDKEIVCKLDTPICIYPGEFIATVMKIVVGTATASQTIIFNVRFDGYYI